MDNITFNDIPQAISLLFAKIENVENLLLQGASNTPKEADELLTVQDAASFLSLSVPTIYGLISKGELPVMKRSKRCYFTKGDLLLYLKQGRKKTQLETTEAANDFIYRKAK